MDLRNWQPEDALLLSSSFSCSVGRVFRVRGSGVEEAMAAGVWDKVGEVTKVQFSSLCSNIVTSVCKSAIQSYLSTLIPVVGMDAVFLAEEKLKKKAASPSVSSSGSTAVEEYRPTDDPSDMISNIVEDFVREVKTAMQTAIGKVASCKDSFWSKDWRTTCSRVAREMFNILDVQLPDCRLEDPTYLTETKDKSGELSSSEFPSSIASDTNLEAMLDAMAQSGFPTDLTESHQVDTARDIPTTSPYKATKLHHVCRKMTVRVKSFFRASKKPRSSETDQSTSETMSSAITETTFLGYSSPNTESPQYQDTEDPLPHADSEVSAPPNMRRHFSASPLVTSWVREHHVRDSLQHSTSLSQVFADESVKTVLQHMTSPVVLDEETPGTSGGLGAQDRPSVRSSSAPCTFIDEECLFTEVLTDTQSQTEDNLSLLVCCEDSISESKREILEMDFTGSPDAPTTSSRSVDPDPPTVERSRRRFFSIHAERLPFIRRRVKKILKKNVQPSVCDFKLKFTCVLQQNNDQKNTSKSTSEWLRENRQRVLEWTSQSPTEML
ncbi:hypothetical protein NFI96_007912 [Prochilodus magdalenae]|nr:hypothetical protein NFI96_007912 [Prochilodus magdalenae]